MNASKSFVAVIVAGLTLVMLGCENQGGGKGRTAQFNLGLDNPKTAGQPAPKNMKNQTVAYESDGAPSPEASLKRDLDLLRQKEKEQAGTIKEMREAMAQGSEIIRKEEDRLADIRRQIENFESAQRLYQQAAATGGNGGEVARASADQNPGGYERQYRTEPAAYAVADYGPASGGQHSANQAARDYPDPRQLSYDNDYAPRSYPRQQGFPTQPPQTQPYAPQSRPIEDEPIWNPPERLFSQTPASAVPAQPPRPARQESPLPPFAQPSRQIIQPVQEESSGAGMRTNTVDDDIFTPDLFLSGEK